MSDNLRLWDAVEKTNPAHTKKVKFGRSITAIDPYHQIKNATEQFGAAGDGWGWSVVDTKFLPTNEVACLVRVWHSSKDKYIEQWGQNGLFIDKAEEKKDADCMKKATTDGLTKCLSMMGFNADIFLGKFDDSKYVQKVAGEFAASEEKAKYNALCDQLAESIDTIKAGIESGEYSAASEAWFELSTEEKETLWKAPSKGGVFTTEERKVMQTSEFRKASQINQE
jgi:hypothetical protein